MSRDNPNRNTALNWSIAVLLGIFFLTMLYSNPTITGSAIGTNTTPIALYPVTEATATFTQQTLPLGTYVEVIIEGQSYQKNIISFIDGEPGIVEFNGEEIYGYDTQLVVDLARFHIRMPEGTYPAMVSLLYDGIQLDQAATDLMVIAQAASPQAREPAPATPTAYPGQEQQEQQAPIPASDPAQEQYPLAPEQQPSDMPVDAPFSAGNDISGNDTLEIEQNASTTAQLIQGQAEINKPVKWTKRVSLNETVHNLTVKLPQNISNVKVRKIVGETAEEIKEDRLIVRETKETKSIKESLIMGVVVKEAEEVKEEIELIIEDSVKEVEIEYETEAPRAIETEIDAHRKEILIYSDVNYTDILAYTTVRESSKDHIKLYRTTDNAREPIEIMNYVDTDNDSLIDKIEWISPSSSHETFEAVIEISKAEHLDEDKSFISDIYEQVKAQDGIWSEPINNSEYVRVVFERKLDSSRDITIFPRIVSGNPSVKIYERNGTELIAEFTSLKENEYNKVYLTNLSGMQDSFDLKVVEGSIELDYIVDPIEGNNGGLAVYGEGTSVTPMFNEWVGTDFGTENAGPTIDSGVVNRVMVVSSTTRNESAIVVGDSEGNILLNVKNNTDDSFGSWLNVSSIGITNDNFRGFYVDVEQDSGDFLVVYERNITNDKVIYYRTWNGTGWSAEETIAFNGAAAAEPQLYIVMQSKSGSDEIMMASAGTSDDITAARWNGSTWLNSTAITTAAAAIDEERFSIAWEGTSGDAMVAYGNGSATTAYKMFNSSTNAWSSEDRIVAIATTAEQIQICSDPQSDYIGAIIGPDALTDVNVAMWNGTGWNSAPPTEDGATENSAMKNAFCSWTKNTSIALFGFVDSNSASIDYFAYNRTGKRWYCPENNLNVTALTTTCTKTGMSDQIQVLRAVSDPTSNDIMIWGIDQAEDLEMFIFNGTSLEQPGIAILEGTTTTVAANEPGWFDYYRIVPPAAPDIDMPTVTALVPTNNTSFNLSTTIEIAANVTDGGTIDAVMANITNSTGNTTLITLSQAGGTPIYNNTYTIPNNSTGVYNITIIANDTSGNANTNQTTQFNAVDQTPPAITNQGCTPSALTTGNSTICNATITDHLTIYTVQANVTLPNGTIESPTISNDTSNYYFNYTNTQINGTYTIAWIANDTNTNLNDTRTTTTFTLNDTYQPTVTAIVPTNNTTNDISTNITIAANITDNGTVNNAQANITLPNSSTVLLTLSQAGGTKIYNTTYTIPDIVGVYNVTIIANDTNANINMNQTTQFNVVAPITASWPSNGLGTFDDDSGDNFVQAEIVDGSGPPNFEGTLTKFSVTVEVTAATGLDDGDGISCTHCETSNESDCVSIGEITETATPLNTEGTYWINSTSSSLLTRIEHNGVEQEWIDCVIAGVYSGPDDLIATISTTFEYTPTADSKQPTVTALVPTNNTSFNLSTTIEIAANVTDGGTIDAVMANITNSTGNTTLITLSQAGGTPIYNNTYTIPNNSTGVYNITIIANDTGGNANTNQTTQFNAVDQTPPAITNLGCTPSALTTGNSTICNATITDHLTIYTVQANVTLPNGTIQNPTISNSTSNFYFNYTNTQINGTYTIAWIANDTNANLNDTRTTTTFTLNDTYKPTVNALVPTNNTSYDISTNITIAANITDNGTVNNAQANITLPNSSTVLLTLTQAGGTKIYNTTYSIPNITGVYNITIIANDTNANINNNQTTQFNAVNESGSNTKPTITALILNEGLAITLFANTTTTVISNVTVSDDDGCEDISSLRGVLRHTSVAYTSPDSNSTLYNTSCTANPDCVPGGEDLAQTFVCTYSMQHYAQPSDGISNFSSYTWNITVVASDASAAEGTGSTTKELDTLTAITLYNSTLNFGTLALGANSTTDVLGAIANTGNEQLDLSLDGYGRTDGDGRAMNCTIGNITVGNIKYSNISFTYDQSANSTTSGFGLTDTATQLDLDIPAGTDLDKTPIKNTYFRIGFPVVGVGGTCTGTITLAEASDPSGD